MDQRKLTPKSPFSRAKKLNDIIEFHWKSTQNILCPMGIFFVSFTLQYWLTLILLDFYNKQTFTLALSSPSNVINMTEQWKQNQCLKNRFVELRLYTHFYYPRAFSCWPYIKNVDILDRNVSTLFTESECRIYQTEFIHTIR